MRPPIWMMGNRLSIFLVFFGQQICCCFIFWSDSSSFLFFWCTAPQTHNTIQLKGLHATIIPTLDTQPALFFFWFCFFFFFFWLFFYFFSLFSCSSWSKSGLLLYQLSTTIDFSFAFRSARLGTTLTQVLAP